MWRERQTIEKNSLGSVVGIVTCGELGAFECLGTDVEGLTTEDTAVRARVLGDAVTTSSAGSNGVEGVAAKELLEREHEERETVERRVAVAPWRALVAVALDALVDAQQLEVPVHVLALVERAQDVRERRRVLASADCHCNSLARAKSASARMHASTLSSIQRTKHSRQRISPSEPRTAPVPLLHVAQTRVFLLTGTSLIPSFFFSHNSFLQSQNNKNKTYLHLTRKRTCEHFTWEEMPLHLGKPAGGFGDVYAGCALFG